MPSSSLNPFRPRVPPPSTGANPLQAQSIRPGISSLEFDDDLPPPYTPGPNSNLGETTLDYNPHWRPHHTPPPSTVSQPPVLPASIQGRPPSATIHARPQTALPPHSSSRSQTLGRQLAEAIASRLSHDPNQGPSRDGPSLRHHLAETIMTHISRELERPPTHAPQGPPSSVWRQLAETVVQNWEHQPQPRTQADYDGPVYSPSRPSHAASETRHGYPTRTPTPGHPLLKDGRLLVYPRGYTCAKCHGTGFKRGIPSRPCRTCWATYSKPFSDSGPLAAAFTRSLSSSPSSASSFTSPSFQRPLPALRSAR
ncbi:hypothetical protein FPV67DRAFT_1728602 [Lyophyllum atratum]|nr:hypothetical protein FPV67DRAFT_1728602 [Lyophyllum atratum]